MRNLYPLLKHTIASSMRFLKHVSLVFTLLSKISCLDLNYFSFVIGDAVAAEYYFWEMQRKGMQPDQYVPNIFLLYCSKKVINFIFFYIFCLCSTTFRNVFRALARAQTVGVSIYWILQFLFSWLTLSCMLCRPACTVQGGATLVHQRNLCQQTTRP